MTIQLSREEVQTLQTMVGMVTISDEVLDCYHDIVDTLARDHGLVISDRTYRTVGKVIKAHALLHGRFSATKDDLAILADSLWYRHDQRPTVVEVIRENTKSVLMEAQEIVDSAREVFNGIRDFRTCSDLEERLDKVMGMEDTLREKDKGEDPDVGVLREELGSIRKQIARGFDAVSNKVTRYGRALG